jgi:hypothetical protein
VSFVAWPDTEHPAYAREAPSIRRFIAEGRYTVAVAVPPKLSFAEPLSPYEPELRIRHLDVKRAMAAAPYVGDPFVYAWKAAVDEVGRWVAGPAEIVYLPPEFP